MKKFKRILSLLLIFAFLLTIMPPLGTIDFTIAGFNVASLSNSFLDFTKTVSASSTKIEGESYSSAITPPGTPTQSGGTGTLVRFEGNSNNTYVYSNLDFTNVTTIDVSSACSATAPTLQVYIDSVSAGNLIASINVPNNGSWNNCVTTSVQLASAITGTHNMYLKLSSSNYQSGLNVDYFALKTGITLLEAESYSNVTNPPSPITASGGTGTYARMTADNQVYIYNNVNLSSIANVAVSCATNGTPTLEFYTDNTNTENLFATISVGNTGNWNTFSIYSTSVSRPVSGTHNVYVKFRTGYASGGMNFDYFNFITGDDSNAVANSLAAYTWNTIRKDNAFQDNVVSDLTLGTANGFGTTLSWSANPTGIIDTTTGVVTPNATQDKQVTLTLTGTKGSATSTKDFVLTVPKTATYTTTTVTVGAETRTPSPATNTFVSMNFTDVGDTKWMNSGSGSSYFKYNDFGRVGGYVEITFYGTGAKVIGCTESDATRSVNVLIDGVAAPGSSDANGKISIGTSASRTYDQTLYEVKNLKPVKHVMRVTIASGYFLFQRFVYTGAIGDAAAIDYDATNLTESAILGSNSSLSLVIANLNLIKAGTFGSTISWSASPSGIINTTTGEVLRGEADVNVTLTATISKGNETPVNKEFVATVKLSNVSDADYIATDLAALTNTVVLNGNSATNNILTALSLPKSGASGSTIAWNTSVAGAIDTNTGIVTRSLDGDVSVTLTATLTKGVAAAQQKILNLVVKGYTYTAQAGANPIVFNQTATTDNIIPLMAAASRHNSELTVFSPDSSGPKHFWADNFGSTSYDFMEWTVNLATGAEYHVEALLSVQANESFTLSVRDTANTLNFSTTITGWDKLDAGKIYIPAGTSKLLLRKTSSTTKLVSLKSLELIRESDRAAYLGRISAFKGDTSWFANSEYGIFFQAGVWGYPQTGNRKSMEQATNDFDVDKFIAMVKSTGTNYIIWSLTWYEYRMQAPIQAVDDIMTNNTGNFASPDDDLTSTRDLVGEIATKCKENGIRFMLYYHSGLNQQPNWLAKQNYPSSFRTTGTGDKTVFFDNWSKVVSEIGNRYGDKLDGWFFDDGCNYYPAPFEKLGAAARAGNPNRLISYNSWTASRFTDFQDYICGEGSHGEADTGSAPIGGNGVYTSGPNKGLLKHASFISENDWGVHNANTTITTGITQTQANGWVESAKGRKVPLSFAMMMYEDGTVSPTTLNIFKTLNSLFNTNRLSLTPVISGLNTDFYIQGVKNDSKVTSASGIFAVYQNNELVQKFTFDDLFANSKDIVTKKITLPSTDVQNATVKVMLWDDFDNIKPLATTSTYATGFTPKDMITWASNRVQVNEQNEGAVLSLTSDTTGDIVSPTFQIDYSQNPQFTINVANSVRNWNATIEIDGVITTLFSDNAQTGVKTVKLWDVAPTYTTGVKNAIIHFGLSGGADASVTLSSIQMSNTATPAIPLQFNAFSLIKAAYYSMNSGCARETSSDSSSGGQQVGYVNNNNYIGFKNVDFGNVGATSMDARIASPNTGGSIEIRLDSSSGTLIGTCSVSDTGGWSTWRTVNSAISSVTGVHDVYLVFTNPNGFVCNINWIQFK